MHRPRTSLSRPWDQGWAPGQMQLTSGQAGNPGPGAGKGPSDTTLHPPPAPALTCLPVSGQCLGLGGGCGKGGPRREWNSSLQDARPASILLATLSGRYPHLAGEETGSERSHFSKATQPARAELGFESGSARSHRLPLNSLWGVCAP